MQFNAKEMIYSFVRSLRLNNLIGKRLRRVHVTAVAAVAWIVITLYFSERFWLAIENSGSLTVRIGVCFVIGWMVLLTLIATYHVSSFMFSIFDAKSASSSPSVELQLECPSVAIFYLCKDDFVRESLRSCTSQAYDDFEVFVLDDSDDQRSRQHIDKFCRSLKKPVKILRRSNKSGFKAGNINNALSHIGDRFKHIVIADADELLPTDFLSKSVSQIEGDRSLAFVQAAHDIYSHGRNGRLFGHGLQTHWNYFLPGRNASGFVFFIGHGALLRYDAIRAVGGFQHVVAEDLDIATRFKAAGFSGYFDSSIVCSEAAPSSYAAFQRRSEKILVGTLEFLFSSCWRFISNPTISIGDRSDVALATVIVLLSIFFTWFLLSVFLVLPVISLASGMSGVEYANSLTLALSSLSGLDFSVLVIFTIAAPAVYSLPRARELPRSRVTQIAQIAQIGGVYLSVIVRLSLRAIRWFWLRDSVFYVTGETRGSKVVEKRRWFDLVIALSFIFAGVIFANLPLALVGTSVVLFPYLIRNFGNAWIARTIIGSPILVCFSVCVYDPVSAAVGIGVFASTSLMQP